MEDAMSIDASHWGLICARIEQHARSIHPNDPKKAKKLEHHLLAISDPREEPDESDLSAVQIFARETGISFREGVRLFFSPFLGFRRELRRIFARKAGEPESPV